MKETKSRSILKSIGYRIILVITNGVIVYIGTKRIDLTLGISLSTAVINTLIYYLYERFWNSIRWGKKTLT